MKRLTTLLAAFCAVALLTQNCGVENEPNSDASAEKSTSELTAPPQTALAAWVREVASDKYQGRAPNTPGSTAVRKYIIAELVKCGVRPGNAGSFEQAYATPSIGTNIIGNIPGLGLAARRIVISAHYDHLGVFFGSLYNGATDNAAGVANVIGLACSIAKSPLRHSVVVALWDGEETGFVGSEYFVDHPTVPLASIDLAVVLDLAGSQLWPSNTQYFAMGGDYSPAVDTAIKGTPVPAGLSVVRTGFRIAESCGPQGSAACQWSDYGAFRNVGIPILFTSDAQNKNYHQTTDDVVNLSLPKMAAEAQWLTDVVSRFDAAVSNRPAFDRYKTNDVVDTNAAVTILNRALQTTGGLPMSTALKTKVEADRTAAKALQTKAQGGAALTSAEALKLKSYVARVLCLARPGTETSCNW